MPWIRLAVLIVLVFNQSLTMAGYNPIPGSEDDFYNFFSHIATFGAIAWNWWKNNNITRAAKTAQKQLDKLKQK